MKVAIQISNESLARRLQVLGDLIGLARGRRVTLSASICADGDKLRVPNAGETVAVVDCPQVFSRSSSVIANMQIEATVVNARVVEKPVPGYHSVTMRGPVLNLRGKNDPVVLRSLLEIRKLCRAQG